jgi:UrcA family protein
MKNVLSSAGLIATGLSCAGLVALFVAGPAAADTPEKETNFAFKFYYQPAELTTPASAQKMLERLETKVREQCGKPTRTSIEDQHLVDKCVESSMKATISTFGSSTVAEAFQARADG